MGGILYSTCARPQCKMKGLKEQVRDLESSRVKDFDPEDDSARRADEDDSEIEEQANGDTGREHYEPVGKSSLRKPESLPLDAKYGGVAISRKALEDKEEDNPFAPVEESDEEDPFAARNGETRAGEESYISVDGNAQEVDEDEEIDSDEALGESDVERFKDFTFRGSRKNRIEAQSQDDLSDEENESTGSEEQSTSDTDVDMDDEEEESNDGFSISSAATQQSEPSNLPRNADRKELQQAAFSTAGLASALSAGANADIKKGRAVKQQRQIFDRLLDARIKLQKGVTAMNSLSEAGISEDEVKQAAQQAEDAALALWSTIDSIRCTMLSTQDMPTMDSKTSRKRPFTATRFTPLSELWQQTNDLESTINPLRRSTLDKWHAKTQPAIDTAPRSKLFKPTQSSRSRLTDVLDAYLATESSKLTTSSTPAPGIFDDVPFYQSLLRDLIASRNANSANATSTSEPFLPTKLHQSGSKNKKVDTKASKGRKVRYTVHEKLENFMAPEDRSTWEDAARREFFASLFGNVGALDEGVGDEQAQSDDEGAEVEALRLFRS